MLCLQTLLRSLPLGTVAQSSKFQRFLPPITVAQLTIGLFLLASPKAEATSLSPPLIKQPLDFAAPKATVRTPSKKSLTHSQDEARNQTSSSKPPTAKTLAQLASSQSGSQISLNGRVVTLPWSQWQTAGITRTGISDAALMQLFGAQLLDTTNSTQQPIEWFAAPQLSSARFAAPFRYVDITTLAQQFGWQVQVQPTQLKITTPPAKVLGIRQGQQPTGERIVIDLDRPTPWQLDPQSQELVLTLDAQIDPATVQNFKAKLTAQVKSIKIEAAPTRTTIRFGIPISLRPRTTTLPNPNRIVIDLQPDYLVNRNIVWANGLRWRQQTLTAGASRFPVIWFEVNPRQPGLSLRPILPNAASIAGIAPLIQTARQTQVSAAINGGFFNRNNQLPLGAIRLKGQWLSGPILNRGVLAWNENGTLKFDRLTLQEKITTSTGQIALNTLNSAYAQAGISRYTSAWGSVYTTFSNGETVFTVENNQVVNQQLVSTAGSSVPIPTNGYLLVARSVANAATLLPVGATLQLESTPFPADLGSYQNIIGAGPLLIQNRQIVLDAKSEKFSDAFIRERAARSAIGQTSDGTLLIVTAQNRNGDKGATLAEIAQIMAQLGAVDALNLDGGSSTTLYLGGQILDRPPRSSARVHNGIGIFLQSVP